MAKQRAQRGEGKFLVLPMSDDELLRLKTIQQRTGIKSRADVLRFLITQFYTNSQPASAALPPESRHGIAQSV